MFTFATQVQSVARGYWITFTFPASLLNIVFLPFKTDLLPQDDAILTIAGLVLAVTALLVLAHRFRHGDAWGEAAVRVDNEGYAFDRSTVRFGIAVYAATIAVVVAASLAMGRVVLMYRYLVIVLGPLCVAAALALARLARTATRGGRVFRFLRQGLRMLAIVFCAACIGIWGAVMASLFDPATGASVETACTVRADGATVLTDSARAGGILAALNPDQRVVYLDFTKDAWWEPGVRRAYGSAVTSVGSWDEALEQTGERVLFISDHDSRRAVEELTRELASEGLRVEEAWRIVRPYDRVTWTFLACARP